MIKIFKKFCSLKIQDSAALTFTTKLYNSSHKTRNFRDTLTVKVNQLSYASNAHIQRNIDGMSKFFTNSKTSGHLPQHCFKLETVIIACNWFLLQTQCRNTSSNVMETNISGAIFNHLPDLGRLILKGFGFLCDFRL